MILRVLRALPGAARELAADLRRALVIDDEALVQWLRAEELADRLRRAEARARQAEQERDVAVRRLSDLRAWAAPKVPYYDLMDEVVRRIDGKASGE